MAIFQHNVWKAWDNLFWVGNKNARLIGAMYLKGKHYVFPSGIYLFKVNNRNIRTMFEIYSELTRKTPERRWWRCWTDFTHCSGFSVVGFVQVNVYWGSDVCVITNEDIQHINPFYATALFLYPLKPHRKTPDFLMFSGRLERDQ